MLRNLIIVSHAGLVLYSKEFVRGVGNPNMVGGLIVAMSTFSQQRTGLPASYIELSSVSVSICESTTHKVRCALFYDSSEGQDFGAVIARELLQEFIGTYGQQGKISNLTDFSGFNVKVSETIRNSVRPVLEDLQLERGINMCMLTSGEQIVHATDEVDRISVLANVQALMGMAQDVMAQKQDVPQQMTFRGARTTIHLVRLRESNLVVVSKNSISPELCQRSIDKAAKLLLKVISMASNLQDSWHMD